MCPLLRLWYRLLEWDHFGHEVVVVSLVDTGPPRAIPLGLGQSGRESVMAMEGFRRNAVCPPEWECEAMGSVVWVQCATSAECIIYREPSPRLRTTHSRSHHESTFNKHKH